MRAHDFALIAQESYSAAPDIGVADSASRAIVRQTDAGLVIAFPGTDNLACFAADFDIEPFDVAGIGRVYRGFFDAWSAISLPVLAAVNGQPVTLVGHSLGAAMALMCAAYMTVGGNPPAAVYGFEPPRVGHDMGIRTVLANVPVHLFKNGNDLVTDVPPAGQHAALLIPIGKPAFPFPNLIDHQIARVIDSLKPVSTQ
ncbi:lipase (class 3) [Paraburkholderia silvatlantica]|uniref:Lipase (Class 3) n=1 Tax=Paraburkholderia silvatlantica TaxID=321895 RepID=A0A2V4TBZ2_9BURK|nr:lipase family protein [Paraburkholderia silvatlantica]PYE21321.1 lipase (class 3) [Paraburkholderia silvatlantica]